MNFRAIVAGLRKTLIQQQPASLSLPSITMFFSRAQKFFSKAQILYRKGCESFDKKYMDSVVALFGIGFLFSQREKTPFFGSMQVLAPQFLADYLSDREYRNMANIVENAPVFEKIFSQIVNTKFVAESGFTIELLTTDGVKDGPRVLGQRVVMPLSLMKYHHSEAIITGSICHQVAHVLCRHSLETLNRVVWIKGMFYYILFRGVVAQQLFFHSFLAISFRGFAFLTANLFKDRKEFEANQLSFEIYKEAGFDLGLFSPSTDCPYKKSWDIVKVK